MCNKCSNTEVTVPATALLVHWAAWKNNSDTSYAIYRVRSHIKESYRAVYPMKTWNARYKKTAVELGREYGKLKAIANKHASRDVTTLQDAEPILNYLSMISNNSHMIAVKVEPFYASINDSEWEKLDVINKLHPAINNQGGDRDAYHIAQKAFYEFNHIHRIHISTEDMNQIAYYPTLKHMRDRREVRTRLGRYLFKYQQAFGLTDSDIKNMAEKHTADMRSRGGWGVEFIEHNDPQGWVDVYASNDVSSCMQNENAVRIYAHEKSVLRLAYVKFGDNIVARCIVRDDDAKGYLRVYPDPNGCAEGRFLLDYLTTNGYGKRTNLDDVLLRYIEQNNGIVCPYIDSGENGDQSVSEVTRDGETYLEVGGGDLQATNTNGYVEDNNSSCDDCGDCHHEDNLTYIESSERDVCDCCRDNNYTYAYGRREEGYYPEHECVEVGGSYYYMETISYHDIYQCEGDGEYYHEDDMESTYDGKYCNNYVTRVDHYTDYEYVYEKNVHTLSDGTTCHENEADEYEAEITEASMETVEQEVV